MIFLRGRDPGNEAGSALGGSRSPRRVPKTLAAQVRHKRENREQHGK